MAKKHSDLVGQTRTEAHPSPAGSWDDDVQRVLRRHQSRPEIFENDQTRWLVLLFSFPLSSSENSRKESGRGTMTAPPPRLPPSLPPSCSPLPCLGQLALVAESLRQVLCRWRAVEAALQPSPRYVPLKESVPLLMGACGSLL